MSDDRKLETGRDWTQHGDTLKPGCALELTLTRMRVHDNELHGVIYAASLAPARWEAHVANALRRRGHAVAGDLSKIYHRPQPCKNSTP